MALVSWNTTRAATVDARFASFTIDSWWLEMWTRNINGTYNFTDPRLARRVRDLGPSVLRVGGGKSDTSYFGGGPLACRFGGPALGGGWRPSAAALLDFETAGCPSPV